LDLAGAACTAIITNTPHNMRETCAIVGNFIALVEGQRVDSPPQPVLLLQRNPLLLALRWIAGSKGSPMHAYAWYVWRKAPRIGPSLKVRIGKRELAGVLGGVLAGRIPTPMIAA
jgi:hypothetical protein